MISKYIEKYRLAANITKYPILSKLILQSIIIPKFMMIRQLFHVKNFPVERKIFVEISS